MIINRFKPEGFLSFKGFTAALILIILHGAGLFCVLHGNNIRTLLSLKQIGSKPLYIMNYYGGYRFKSYLKTGSETYQELNRFLNKRLLHASSINDDNSFACSAFSSYNLKDEPIYGRNLDIPGNHPAVLLCSNPPDGYASVSMVELTVLGYPDKLGDLTTKLSSFRGRKALLAAPYMPRDGMNEYGLVVSTLNTPPQTPQKDPCKTTIGRWQALRLMLDYAKNVDEALKLLKEYNSFDGEVHFFIADAAGNSVIAEYVDGDFLITPRTEQFQIVTNFIVAHPIQPGGGHDRYNKLYDTLNSVRGRLSEGAAMALLKAASQPSTAWSVIYNQASGEISVAMGGEFNDIISFRFKSVTSRKTSSKKNGR
jgi:hypothetical protein